MKGCCILRMYNRVFALAQTQRSITSIPRANVQLFSFETGNSLCELLLTLLQHDSVFLIDSYLISNSDMYITIASLAAALLLFAQPSLGARKQIDIG
jgi:hypothetical protein